MASPTNHWKLGLFVIFSVLLGLGVVVVLGARSLQKELITYSTYFDESVQGLEIGSPVKFRGVTIGNVAEIAIGPDRRHVRVDADLIVDDISAMGLAVRRVGKEVEINVPADLRAQLVSMGITGVKFLQIDYFAIEDNPAPKLPFVLPANYIPAAMSTMKNIEDSLVAAINRIPEVAENAAEIMKRINGILADVEDRAMPQKAEALLVKTHGVLARLDASLAGLKTDVLSTEARATLSHIDGAVIKLDALVARAGAKDGMFDSAERASMAVGDVAANAAGVSGELEQTLRAVNDAATSLQRLTDALERDSDMLLKGRATRGP